MKRGTRLVLLWALVCSLQAAAQPPADRELKVELVAPSGRAQKVSQITIAFNQPMVALGVMERTADAVPVQVSCKQTGQWRWLDTSTLAYLYAAALPPSTGCTVTVTAEAKALSGKSLAQPLITQFETERIGLLRSQPEAGATDLELQPEITVTFSQQVKLDSLGKLAKFVYRRGKEGLVEVPATVKALPPAQANEIRLPPVDVARSYVFRPVRPLLRETEFQLVLQPGLAPEEGELPSESKFSLSFQTYPFLKVREVSCNSDCRPDCDPTGGITLSFTTPVEETRALGMIRIDPPLAKPDSAEGGEAGEEPAESFTSWLHIPGPFEPDKDYTITLLPDLEDQYGQRLGTLEKHSFHFGMYWPALDISGPFAIFESQGEHRYPLGTRNAEDATLRYRFFRKDEILPFLKGNNLLAGGETADLLAGVQSVQTQKLGLPVQRNRFFFWPLELDKLFGPDLGSGLAYLEASSEVIRQKYTCDPSQPFRSPVALQVTDLGLSAKFGYFKTLVWVTSLSKGEPQGGVSVEIRGDDNKVLYSGQTGADGILEAPGRKDFGLGDEGGWREFPLLWVFAQKGADLAVIHSSWSDGIEAWSFGLSQDDLRSSTNLLVYGFTDRPIYRPGDSVRWKAIARSIVQDRLGAPLQRQVLVQLSDSQGETLQSQTVSMNDFGTAAGEIQLGRKAKLGWYSLMAGYDADHLTSVGSFQVEEYRAPTFKVEVKPSTGSFMPGDRASFGLQARYFFGAPVTGSTIRWSVSRNPSGFQPKVLEGYETGLGFKAGEEYSPPYGQTVTEGLQELSPEGSASAEVSVAAEELPSPMVYELEAQVPAPDSRIVAGRGSVLVHPAELYVGLRPKSWAAEVGQSMDVDVLVARPDGQVQAGVLVNIKLYRRTYNVVRRKGVGSFYHYENSIEDADAGAFSVTSAATPTAAPLRVDKAGQYFAVAEVIDSKGRKARSSTSFYAWGGALAGWARYDHDRIDLVPEKGELAIGEVAKILVKSPYERALALVTVERDSVLRHFQTELQGSAALVEVPILAGDAPNVFVSVVLVQGRLTEKFSQDGVDLGKPSFKIGYASLNVRDPSKKLAVSVVPQKPGYGPKEHVRAELSVADAAGGPVPSELCVVAVDEAVLSLVSDLRYDPYEYFYSPRSLGVRTVDGRIHLIGRRHFGTKGENPGGGGGPAAFRKDFRTVAFFSAQLTTDAQGKAVVEFDLPDNLTTFRIIAVAGDKLERFGSGWGQVTVSKPLVSQPALPRFLVQGDKAELGVVLNNGTGGAGEASVSLQGQGFEPSAPPARAVSLAAGASAEVRFAVRAQAAEKLLLQFSSILGAHRDDLEMSLPVHDVTPLDTYAVYGSVTDEGTTSAELLVPADARTDRGGLSVSVSATIASTLEGAVDWLQSYPYTCLEQQTSRALTYGIRLSLADRMRSSGLSAEAAAAGLEDFLANVSSFQSYDGGFDYWPGDPGTRMEDPYLTAYVVMALHYLEAMGHKSDASVVSRAADYLDNVVRHDGWPWYYTAEAKREARAFALSALGLRGRLEEGVVQSTMADRAKLSIFALACLMDAQLQLGGKSEGYEIVKTLLMSRAVITPAETGFQETEDDGLRITLSSPARSNARLLLVLAGAEPAGDLGPKLMRWLMTAQKAGRWENTHDNAFCLLAAHEYLKVWEARKPAFEVSAVLRGLAGGGETQVSAAARTLGQWKFAGAAAAPQALAVAAAELQPGKSLSLDLQKTGSGRLYYGLRLQVARTKPSSDPVNAGFSVLRSYSAVDPGPVAGVFPRGKLVKVRLTVTVPALRHFVAIEDPLPAGFEAVNLRLATESQSEAAAVQPAGEGDDSHWDRWYQHVEKRDDRVVIYSTYLPAGSYTYEYLARATTVGTFTAGAPRAEEMYTPEVYGRGAPAEVHVAE